MNIKRIDIIHHSHCDYGYTDHQVVTAELQKRYIDRVLKLIIETKDRPLNERFCWTAEVNDPIFQWWKDADATSKRILLDAIGRGQFEVCAFPMNNTAFLNDDEIEKMINWIPDELWDAFSISTIMQVDVNGIPSASVYKACKKKVKYLWMSPNSYLGSSSKDSPRAFNWKLSPSDKVFVWLNNGYENAHDLFFDNWRVGPIPKASDTCFREPNNSDFFRCDDESVKKSHEKLVKKLDELLENKEYLYFSLPVSLTNQWRMDNDPPFSGLSEFVAKWNSLGLMPELRLSTVSAALSSIEVETLNKRTPSYTGEWTDWWAKGTISAPIEVAASKKAKMLYKIAKTLPACKDTEEAEDKLLDRSMKDLCRFDEHTYGSWSSVARPDSVAAKGEWAEKSNYAYKALARTELICSDRIRYMFKDAEEGIYVYNPSEVNFNGWAEIPYNALRGDYASLMDKSTLKIEKLYFYPGDENFELSNKNEMYSLFNNSRTFPDQAPNKIVRFWTEIPPKGIKCYIPLNTPDYIINDKIGPSITTDENGWPLKLYWANGKSLSGTAMADFISYSFNGLNQRRLMRELFNTEDEKAREVLLSQYTDKNISEYSQVIKTDTLKAVIFEQYFNNKSLLGGKRELQVWKDEPRISVTVKINRPYNLDPEAYFINFNLNNNSAPVISNGGKIFEPGRGQLDDTCMDYYAFDGWVSYPYKGVLWVSKDAPLISFGDTNFFAKRKEFPENTGNIYSYIFDNTWDTNFIADSHGVMTFKYDIIIGENFDDFSMVKNLAEGFIKEPIITVKLK